MPAAERRRRRIERARIRFLVLAAVLLGPFAPHARGQSIHLIPQVGISGLARAGAWYPVTVDIVGASAPAIDGRVEVFASRGAAGPLSHAGPVFSVPFASPAGPLNRTVVVYCRGIDSVADTMTVRLVSGPRGDGQTIARAVLGYGTPNRPAIQISSPDLLLVGVADTPGMFRSLQSQTIGVAHVPSGLRPPITSRVAPRTFGLRDPMIGVAECTASQLPDKAAGFDGVDAILLRADSSLDVLTEAQMKAIEDYVALGGRLILFDAGQAVDGTNGLVADLAPAYLGPPARTVTLPGFGTMPAGMLLPRSLTAPRTLLAGSDGRPLAVSGSYGAGSVTVVAAVLSAGTPGSAPPSESKTFWRALIADGQSQRTSLLGLAGGGEDETHYPSAYGNPTLGLAARQSPSLDPPGLGIVGLFLAGYLIVVVPLNYFVLKRLGRRELAWITIPALVVLFTVGAYGGGYVTKGSGLFVNRVSVVETSAGSTRAGVVGSEGVFSSTMRTYDMRLADPDAVVTTDPIDSRNDPLGTVAQTRLVQSGFDERIERAMIPQWAMRSFDIRTVVDLQGSFEGSFAYGPSEWIKGAVVNKTPFALTGCSLYWQGRRVAAPDLQPGATASFDRPMQRQSSESPTGDATWAALPGGRSDGRNVSPEERLKAGIASVIDQAWQNTAYVYPGQYIYQSSATPPYVGRPDEVYLVGWSYDSLLPGSLLQVQGAAPAHHDMSLVVIGFPLTGTRH